MVFPGPVRRLGAFCPRAICQIYGPIIDPKMSFYSLGIELSEYVAKCSLKITDDVTRCVKRQIFQLPVIAGFAGQNSLSD